MDGGEWPNKRLVVACLSFDGWWTKSGTNSHAVDKHEHRMGCLVGNLAFELTPKEKWREGGGQAASLPVGWLVVGRSSLELTNSRNHRIIC